MDNITEASHAKAKDAIKGYFHKLLDIRGDMMSYKELDKMMAENTVIHGSNMWILMLAILIASIGLNVNSTAVIIGAMLISPLMSGILTMGYSLAIRDLTMLKRALGRFGTQVLISLITSTLYFLITPLDVATDEMIARTSPTIWDVLIALFGGLAGMIGNTRQKKGNVIPGVAIATALMPPLCTAGYGLATLQPKFLLGAFYLFLINTLFIMLSSAFVTVLLRVPVHHSVNTKQQKRINHIVALITTITIIPSVLIGTITVHRTVIEQNVNNYLKSEFVFQDTQVVQSSADNLNKVISVSLVGETVSDEVIGRLEQELDNYNLSGYTLRVTQNKNTEVDNSDSVTIALQKEEIKALGNKLTEQQEKINNLENQLKSRVDCKEIAENSQKIFTKLSDCSCGIMSDTNGDYILLTATAEKSLTDDESNTIKNWLITESGISKAELQITIKPKTNVKPDTSQNPAN